MDESSSSLDLSTSTSAESSLGWYSGQEPENSNMSHQNIGDSSDTSTDNDSISEKSDVKSFNKNIVIKKEKITHQLSDEEESTSPILDSGKKIVPKQCKLEEGLATKIIIDGTLDTTESIPFNLDSDDEVWMVQCPANVEAGDLKGSKIDIGGISTFGANYIGTSLSQKTDAGSNINLLIQNKHFELMTVPVAGQIIITLKVDVPPLELPAIKNKIATPLPEGLKLRHPLLGIVNSNSKSIDCDAAYVNKHKMKRKHKHNDSSQATTYSDSEISPSPNKKKKKKKELSESIELAQNISRTENDNEFEDVIESSQATKNNKLSLHEDNGSELLFPLTQFSDVETNNSSLERKKKKKKKKDKSGVMESSVQDEDLETPTHFKKKKRKSDTDDSFSLLNTAVPTHFKKNNRKSDTDESISLLNTSVSKKRAKTCIVDQELILQSDNSSPKRMVLKRCHSENEANHVSAKKKKFKLSHSQDGE